MIKLSVIIVIYEMDRAAPRSILSLLPPYQQGLSAEDYEVLVVDNGSASPIPAEQIESMGANVRYICLESPPPSPAYAINHAASLARGEVLAIMIDGAHILTPGVLGSALDMYKARPNPLVLTAPFFLGPGPQMRTIAEGYDEAAEDRLLNDIAWPEAGYRLFEIGVPYRLIEDPETRPKLFWFVRMFESNCLFVRRETFTSIGGCDQRFNLPGGGILLPALYRELCRLPDTDIVQLLGEASFHQVHGGVSTNTSVADQRDKWNSYLEQYEQIRGEPFEVSQKPLRFYGHMPNGHASRLMKTG